MKLLAKILSVIIVLFLSINVGSASTSKIQKNIDVVENDKDVVVLLYHHFVKTEEEIENFSYSTTLTISRFEEHLNALKQDGYETIKLEQLYNNDLPEKPLLITFDDGYISNYLYAYPLLKKYDMKASLFVSIEPMERRIGWDNAREMMESELIEFGYHGWTHLDCTKMSLLDFAINTSNSIEMFTRELGWDTIKAFSYPHSKYNDDTRKVLKKMGFKMQFTGIGVNSKDISNVKRLNVSGNMSGDDLLVFIENWKHLKQ